MYAEGTAYTVVPAMLPKPIPAAGWPSLTFFACVVKVAPANTVALTLTLPVASAHSAVFTLIILAGPAEQEIVAG